MPAANASHFPVYAQAFRHTGAIVAVATLRPITGGLTTLAATISKDGGAFGATGSAPAEIGTTGYFTLDLTAAEMTANTVVIQVTSADAGAVYERTVYRTVDLTENSTRARSQTVLRLEQFLVQSWARWFNRFTQSRSTGAATLYQADDATVQATGSVAQASDTITVSKLS